MQLPSAGRVVLFCLSTAICAFQAVFGRDGVDAASGGESCRCAVLYSGHVRSFVQPRVHLSHKKHLIEQLQKGCDVDVFMYISVEDEVPRRYQTGHFEDALFFTPHTPQHPEVDVAVGVLNPVSIEYHQEQAGFIPNACENSCETNAFWQLYKMQAVYRIMEEHETATKLPYTWVIRSRLDIAWMLPLPPLSRFSPSRVYAGHNFFPLADQFVLAPRRFAQTLFGAVRLCYDCKALQVHGELGIPAQTESLLRMVLRGEDGGDNSSSAPFGYYEFPVVIVRNNEGGVCEVLQPHKLTCEVLRVAGYAPDPVALMENGEYQPGSFRCMTVMRRWYKEACAAMFPPLDFGTEFDSVAVGREGDAAGVASRTFNDGERGDDGGHRQRVARADLRNEPRRGEAIISFEEATRRVEGLHRDLSDLLGMMRVDVAPTQKRWSYFLAHHYPFHRANPFHPAERGLLDTVSIIEGHRLSGADFNRLVLAFSCSLSGAAAAIAVRDHEGEGIASGSRRQRGAAAGGEEEILVLKTTTAEEEEQQASVNCSMVESLHDVWGLLLENTFEPPEPICHGPIGPCLERALAETRDM